MSKNLTDIICGTEVNNHILSFDILKCYNIIKQKEEGGKMFHVNEYIRYKGRVMIISYVDEHGIFAEDVDYDESFLILPDEFDEIVAF